MHTSQHAPRPEGTTFYVFADYGYASEREIYSGTDWAEAQAIFSGETADPEDMDCTMSIDLASFAEDGEYLTHDCVAPAEEEEGDEGVYDTTHPAALYA